jgi:hypothetical protein
MGFDILTKKFNNMRGIFSAVIIAFLLVFSNQTYAQQSGDLDSLVEQLKKEAIENRAMLEQFISPEMLDEVMKSLNEIDLNDLKNQLDGINLGDFLNEDLLNSPLLKGLSLDNLDLNEILNSDFFDLFNFSLPDTKESEEEEGKIKI